MNFLGFGQSAEIEIVFDDAEQRKTAEVKGEDGKVEKLLLYYDGETVSGKVNVTLKKPGSKLEHQGIKIEFIGQIELFYDRGTHHEFKCLSKALARPGDLLQNNSYPFDFPNVEKQFEVYTGANVRLRYFLRATITRRISDITREVDIAVHTLCSYPEMNNPIKMEVGIEDCLHIEFEYNKSKYHLKDTIIGKIYFLLVRIKIKHMEIAIIKRESTGTGPNMYSENETIAKYEIMDGAPVKGESIPIRVFLAGYNLTPTMREINKKFSVKYFLNLVLMDTEDRRYFKQQEIVLWRRPDTPRLHASAQQQQQQQHQLQQQQHHQQQQQQQQHQAQSVQAQQQKQQLQQHQHVPQHAPPHLVSGPAAPKVAASLLTTVHENDEVPILPEAAEIIPTASATTIASPIAAAATGGAPIEITTPLDETAESKMGLFTCESPNQEFAQQQIGSPIGLPSSPLLPHTDRALPTQEIAASIAAIKTGPVPIERGIGDGAAASNATPIMLSTTPPPLSVHAGGVINEQQQKVSPDFMISDQQQNDSSNNDDVAYNKANAIDVNDEAHFTEISLAPTTKSPQAAATTKPTTAVSNASDAKKLATATPLTAD